MTGTIVLIFHLLGFGLFTTILVAGFILERRFRREVDFRIMSAVGGASRGIGLLSPFAALLMLLTGIGNIYHRHLGTTLAWYGEGWLVAKIILFVIFVLNGVLGGPRLVRNRMKILSAQADQGAQPNSDALVRSINRQLNLFYFVQTILFLLIVCLSVFGAGKHS